MTEPRLAALPLTLVYEELLETSLSSHFLTVLIKSFLYLIIL